MISTSPWLRRLASALVGAAATALISHLVNLLAFFVGNQLQSTVLPQVNSYFAVMTAIGFVVVFAGAVFGGLTRWYLAAPLGLVAGVVGVVVGLVSQILGTGGELSSTVWASLFASLGSLNLVFILAFTVTATTAGRVLARATSSATTRAGRGGASGSAGGARRVALVRAPAGDLALGELTHLERVPVDGDLADEQWDAYVAALTAEGWTIEEVEPASDLPDAVFVEDAVIVFGDAAVVARSGAQSRRGETAAVEKTVRAMGLTIRSIQEPGTLDGGDVLKVGRTVYVGRGGRTNGHGIRQLRAIVGPLGYTVVAVPLSKVLHLKSAATALPDGTVIGYEPALDDPRVFERFIAMPEESGAHVVVLDEATVLMAASAPLSARLLEEWGYRVVLVDISEFEKLEGCVTCLSVRVRGAR